MEGVHNRIQSGHWGVGNCRVGNCRMGNCRWAIVMWANVGWAIFGGQLSCEQFSCEQLSCEQLSCEQQSDEQLSVSNRRWAIVGGQLWLSYCRWAVVVAGCLSGWAVDRVSSWRVSNWPCEQLTRKYVGSWRWAIFVWANIGMGNRRVSNWRCTLVRSCGSR